MVTLSVWGGLPLEAVPFTTSVVLVMAAPESSLAQPRNVIGGHILCALSGCLVWLLLGTNFWFAGLAVALAIAAMQLTRTLHPPAGINALLFVTMSLSWHFVLVPVAAGAALLVGFAYVYHRFTSPMPWPRAWWRPVD